VIDVRNNYLVSKEVIKDKILDLKNRKILTKSLCCCQQSHICRKIGRVSHGLEIKMDLEFEVKVTSINYLILLIRKFS